MIQVKTANGWASAETWGTDHHTYPSKTVREKLRKEKRTDVRGNQNEREILLRKEIALVYNSSG
jgi:hypothetical protein